MILFIAYERDATQLLQSYWLSAVAVISGGFVVYTCTRVLIERENGMADILHRIRGPLHSDDRRLIAVVREHFLIPPSLLPYNLAKPQDLGYHEYSKGDSWNIIHTYLKTLFTNEPPGFFVEAGALDGEFLSNTLWLEQSHGWTGLLIEPDEASFFHLQNKQRKSWLIDACLSHDIFPEEVVHVTRTAREGKESVGIPWYTRGSAHELNVDVEPETSVFALLSEETYSVAQCFPLETLLLALNVSTVDFLSLDIQGREKDVLRTVPFSKIKIRVIAVEIVESSVDQSFIDFMEGNGYVLLNKDTLPLIRDHIYVRRDEAILHQKLKHFVFSFKSFNRKSLAFNYEKR
ncbi:protein Star-like [Macrobrachium rosenbergii]|uniref:protein Star-like n=1 Tax=Macrobrachium rosenbergii TaxID=79674 RepID=UPI0034D6E7F9